MGWGFRRSVKIAPGVRLNFGKKSASVRVGGRGFGVTKSTTGKTTVSGGIPGTGVYYRETVGGGAPKRPRDTQLPSDQAEGPVGPEQPNGPGYASGPAPPETAMLPAVVEQPRSRPAPATWQYVILGAAVVVMFFSLAGNAGGALGLAGLALAGWAFFQSRVAKWPLVAAGAVLLVAGLGQTGAQARQPQPAEPVPSPAATVTTTVTATATPTPTPTAAPSGTPTATPASEVPSAAAVAPFVAPEPTRAETSGAGRTNGSATGGGGSSSGGSVSYANCTEARAAGVAPLHRGDPGYSSKLDRDGDGVACE